MKEESGFLRVLTLAQVVEMGIGSGKKQPCQGRKVTKLKQEKMEMWLRKPVELASSLELFGVLGEGGNQSFKAAC